MTALPAHNPLHHDTDDAEKILRVFGEWQQEWDENGNNAIQDTDFAAQVKYAIQLYGQFKTPLEVRWLLAEAYGRKCRVKRVQEAAQAALLAQESVPRETRLAIIGYQRSQVAQAALACGQLGVALKALDRAGDVLGELSAESGLGADDLRLVVEIEGDGEGLPLPAGDGDAIQADTEQLETAETGENQG
jgi:hypothetical protein